MGQYLLKHVKRIIRLFGSNPVSALLLILFLSLHYLLQPGQSTLPPSTISLTPTPAVLATQSAQLARAIRVIDGDTIQIDSGQMVRYIGIDTPELSATNGDTCYATSAARLNAQLVLDKDLYLTTDTSDTDRYNRLLRYVYTSDGTFVNSYLVKWGAARAKRYPPDDTFHTQFIADQNYAQQNNLGLWAQCPQ